MSEELPGIIASIIIAEIIMLLAGFGLSHKCDRIEGRIRDLETKETEREYGGRGEGE